MNPLTPLNRLHERTWDGLKDVLHPVVYPIAGALVGLVDRIRTTLAGTQYVVVVPGPGGSHTVISTHRGKSEALIVLSALIQSRPYATVLLADDVARHNREVAMRAYRAATATTYCGPDAEVRTLPTREPGATLRDPDGHS